MTRTQRTDGIEWGVAEFAMPGEERSGDLHLVCETRLGTLLAVVDGIGHGGPAADAAALTVDTLERALSSGVIPAVRRCHEALIGTRGVVLSLAIINSSDQTLTWIGVGNVSGVLMRADPRAHPRTEELLSRAGVIGMHLPQLQASVCSIVEGDVIALATDGIRPGFLELLATRQTPARMASRILSAHSRGTDDALALIARYVGNTPPSVNVVEGA